MQASKKPLIACAAAAVVASATLAGIAAQQRPIEGPRAYLMKENGSNPTPACSPVPAQLLPCALEKIKTFNPPRTPDGKPNFQGHWDRAGNREHRTAAFILEEHPSGEAGQISPGKSLIVDPADGKIPYKPEWIARHPDMIKTYIDQQAICLPVGIPRHFLGPGFYQILQSPGYVTFLSEHAGHVRIIPTDGRPHISAKPKLWLGDSVGRWEGNTLVVDTTNQNGQSFMALISKDFTSADVHVVERYTMYDQDSILLEVTIEDPKVYTRPWKMAWAKTRAPGFQEQIIEEACYEGNHSDEIAVPRLRFLGIDSLK